MPALSVQRRGLKRGEERRYSLLSLGLKRGASEGERLYVLSKILSLSLEEVEKRLGYSFKKRELLQVALTHASYLNENRGMGQGDNERLEFLGDAVLNLIVAEFLLEEFRDRKEGELSFLRSRLVDGPSCARLLRALSLEEALLLGKGERVNLHLSRERLYADLFEALLGAIFLDGGFEAVRGLFRLHFKEQMLEATKNPSRNWKAELQDELQKGKLQSALYSVVGEEGPDHAKEFSIQVWSGEALLGEGRGSTKKEAEQRAAEAALKGLHGNY